MKVHLFTAYPGNSNLPGLESVSFDRPSPRHICLQLWRWAPTRSSSLFSALGPNVLPLTFHPSFQTNEDWCLNTVALTTWWAALQLCACTLTRVCALWPALLRRQRTHLHCVPVVLQACRPYPPPQDTDRASAPTIHLFTGSPEIPNSRNRSHNDLRTDPKVTHQRPQPALHRQPGNFEFP